MKNNEKFINVLIRGIGTYLPENKIGNQPYIEHFKKLGMDNIEELFESIGRKYRHISTDLNENSITMGVQASLKALENAKMKPEEIDIIVFASDTPEYTTPSNALKVHNAIGAKNAKIAYDINANCLAVVLSIDQVTRFLKTSKRYKRALIIGSVLISAVAKNDDFLTYGTFSDSASAIILECVEEDKERGVIDSIYHTDSSQHNTSHSPLIGFSNFFRTDVKDKELIKWQSYPVDAKTYPTVWANLTTQILKDNNLDSNDIDFFIYSQFVENLIIETLQILKIENFHDKYNFLSKETGYTGVNCEMFALENAIKDNRVGEGSKIILSAIGVGFSTMAIYYKF